MSRCLITWAATNHYQKFKCKSDHDHGSLFNLINENHREARIHTLLSKKEDKESDLVVVLDLDECLIHSKFFHSSDDIYRQYETDRAIRMQFESSRDSNVSKDQPSQNLSSEDIFFLTLPGGEGVQVNKRPNLDYFLEQVTRRYDTFIFTAAMEVYASPLLDVLDPHRTKFVHRYYREHCDYHPHVQAYVKDLSTIIRHQHPTRRSTTSLSSCTSLSPPLSFSRKNPLRRMVLVDNNPLSFIANPRNGILVSNFYDDNTDDTLNAVLDILSELEDQEDVRPYLDERFGMESALHEATGGFVWNSNHQEDET